MNRKTALVIFAGIMVLGGSLYFVVHQGFYPVAIANSTIITARSFSKEFSAALQSYSVLAHSSKETQSDPLDADSIKELRRLALDALIEKAIIHRALEVKVGSELDALVEKKIASVDLQRKNFPQAVKQLYGLSLSDFETLVMRPQAERELLSGRLTVENQGETLETLLLKERTAAKVRVFVRGFHWEAGEVKAR
jgi:hypothetical protein